jgi:hypothetical protein
VPRDLLILRRLLTDQRMTDPPAAAKEFRARRYGKFGNE